MPPLGLWDLAAGRFIRGGKFDRQYRAVGHALVLTCQASFLEAEIPDVWPRIGIRAAPSCRVGKNVEKSRS